MNDHAHALWSRLFPDGVLELRCPPLGTEKIFGDFGAGSGMSEAQAWCSSVGLFFLLAYARLFLRLGGSS